MPELTHAEKTQMMTLWLDRDHWFPFVEDENLFITGPGHQDPEVFAASVNAYSRYCSDGVSADGPEVDPDDVAHIHVLVEGEADEECAFVPCAPETPGAMPATTVWNR